MTKNTERGRGRPASYALAPYDECLATLWELYREEGEIAQTIRHYYYGLKRKHKIELDLTLAKSGDAAYKGVVRLLKKARKSRDFPYYAVIDISRRSLGTYTSNMTLASYSRTIEGGYFSLDPWAWQRERPEIFCEKDGMANFVYGVVSKWRIPVYATKGYGSISMLEEAARRYAKGNIVLAHVGDFDPSGCDIPRALSDGIVEHGGPRIQVERVALNLEDLPLLDEGEQLAYNPKDTRHKAFLATYGEHQKCYQLESMPAGIMRQKILDFVHRHVNADEFQHALWIEKEMTRIGGQALEGAKEKLLQLTAPLMQDDQSRKYLLGADHHIDNYSTYDIIADDDTDY